VKFRSKAKENEEDRAAIRPRPMFRCKIDGVEVVLQCDFDDVLRMCDLVGKLLQIFAAEEV